MFGIERHNPRMSNPEMLDSKIGASSGLDRHNPRMSNPDMIDEYISKIIECMTVYDVKTEEIEQEEQRKRTRKKEFKMYQ
jgi:hypothetical protein